MNIALSSLRQVLPSKLVTVPPNSVRGLRKAAPPEFWVARRRGVVQVTVMTVPASIQPEGYCCYLLQKRSE